MTRLDTSPLGAELDAARVEGTEDVVARATGRHRPVLATRLPGSERERAFQRAVAEMFSSRDMDLEVGDVG